MDSIRVTTSHTAAQRVGEFLRDLRRRRRLTGEQLAKQAGTSQSRISKIENGYSDTIDITQVEKLLDILDASKSIRQQISILLFRLTKSSEQPAYPFTDFPDTLNQLQKTATVFRCYVISGISAVMQTSEYRSAYLQKAGITGPKLQSELLKTVERQDALLDTSKLFYIVMPETALYTMPANPRVQTTQLDRLERVIGFSNLRLGIIPTHAGSSVFETGTFTFYDDRILYATVGDRVMELKDADVLLKFINAFEDLSNMACYDTEAIELIRKAGDYFSALS